ncbi:unnamed protein product [Lasius platythorax]|uniref:Uncharacterized protein n=1 Tax=Lasius platythorax TaxID=488582 RepID=A0AAV2P345_9HYME
MFPTSFREIPPPSSKPEKNRRRQERDVPAFSPVRFRYGHRSGDRRRDEVSNPSGLSTSVTMHRDYWLCSHPNA